MASTNKTSYGLNQWEGTDKPQRADFNADNKRLDDVLKTYTQDQNALTGAINSLTNTVESHTAATAQHLTAYQGNKIGQALRIKTGTYTGDGAGTRRISLDLPPMLFMVYAVDDAPTSYHTDTTRVRFAIGTTEGSSQGLTVTKTYFDVKHATTSAPNMKNPYLNENGKKYHYIYLYL